MRRAVCGIMGAALAAMLGARGVPAQCCGDCNGDGSVTVDEILKAINSALTTCSDDHICKQRFPATGQTTAYGPGSDGDVRAGAALAYTDNGDGTITDNNTGLMWEKKDDSGGIHDVNNIYSWSDAASYGGTNIMDGTIATMFLAPLNAGTGFAGHTDWHIPNIKELQSIANYERPEGPTVDPVFHQASTCTGCTDVTAASCSCTAPNNYWSSTTERGSPNVAWFVYFNTGFVQGAPKYNVFRARAVRGSL